MPPKRVVLSKQPQARSIPYDLRRTNMPHEEPPPAPGEKAKRTYMPRKTSQAIAAIRNEAKKQAISKPAARNVVERKQRAGSSAAATQPRQNTQTTSTYRSKTPSRSRSRSISRAASTAVSTQPPKRVRFSAEPPMASGALQPAAASSDQNTGSEEEEELDEEESEAEEEEDTEVELPTVPRRPIDPRQLARNIANIGSSDFEALQNHADNAAGVYYNARENYKDAQHIVRLVDARRHYMNMRHDGPITSDAEEALEEAMISADFPLEVSLQLYANKKVIVRKVLGTITRKTFKADNIKSIIIQLFKHACGSVEYTLIKCTATFKHSSGRGGTRAHDLDDITEAEAEELLDLIEAARNRHSTGHMIVAFAIYVEYDPQEAARAAAATVTGDISSPLPSSPPTTLAPAKKSRKSRTSYLQEQNDARVQAIQNVGDFQRQLMERWRCIDDNCTNRNNFCFPDPQDRSKHYNITAPQHESWASAISRSEATIHSPPIKIWQYWQSQGAITRESREPARRSAAASRQATLERFMEMQAQNMEIMMQQRMMEQMENMEEKQERRDEIKERQQLQRDIRQQELEFRTASSLSCRPPLSPEIAFNSPLYSASISTPRPAATPTPTPIQAPVAPLMTLSRNSSPIDIAEEDATILASFLDWKVQMTRNLERQTKWERARKIIKDNDWSIRDLQLMEDEYSSMYNRAIKAGISDGFARSFREEIRTYKLVYRQQRGAREEEAIQTLRSMGGGF